ncbi:MAG: hypothetical protein WBD09_09245 [Halobacteriota archaeon]
MEKKKTLAIGITLLAIVASSIGVIYYSILTAEETLTNYEEVIEYGEKHVVFYEDGDRILTFSFVYHDDYERKMYGRLIPLRLAVWHRGGTHIDSMRIEIQPTDMKPAEIYFETHGNPYPPILFYEKDLATVVEIPDVGIKGRGTVTFDFLVKPLWEVENKTNFTVDVEAKLSENGVFWKKYAARCQTEIEI